MNMHLLNKTFWLGLIGSLTLISNSYAHSFSICELTDQDVDSTDQLLKMTSEFTFFNAIIILCFHYGRSFLRPL